MIVVLIGAPGAGKGTQADLLVERGSQFKKVSTGDALRNQVRIGSKVGKEAEGFMKEGKLVPDRVLFDILSAELQVDPDKVVLLDGYPRNLIQAETLQGLTGQNTVIGCVHLDISQDKLAERLSGRRVCESCGASYHVKFSPPKEDGNCRKCGGTIVQRPDDHESKVAVRLEVYEKQTQPVLEFYRAKGLYHRISGEGSTETIHRNMKVEIDRLVAQ